jgi:hypothetical protein
MRIECKASDLHKRIDEAFQGAVDIHEAIHPAPFSVGDKVRKIGACLCTATPSVGDTVFHDVRDCFHKPSTVGIVFRDGESVWVKNRYGFARRFYNEVLLAG